MSALEWLARLIWWFLPAGVANMTPVLMGQHFLWLAKPMDGGALLWGQPLFGKNKTWRGLICGTVAGGLFFLLQRCAALLWPEALSLGIYDYSVFPWWFGVLFAAAALGGDLLKSFFKRRFRIPPGQTWFPFDQFDYLVGPTLCNLLFAPVDTMMWVVILSTGIVFHVGVNRIGYRLNLKTTPW